MSWWLVWGGWLGGSGARSGWRSRSFVCVANIGGVDDDWFIGKKEVLAGPRGEKVFVGAAEVWVRVGVRPYIAAGLGVGFGL